MLNAIAVRWLRGIKQVTIDGLSEVNVFIGRNGAGKSTLLEAIYLASSWANPRDELRDMPKLDYVVFRRGGRGGWSNARDSLWYFMETDREIEIDMVFNSGRRLEFRALHFAGSDRAIGLKLSEEMKKAVEPIHRWEPEYRYNLYNNVILNARARTFISPSYEL